MKRIFITISVGIVIFARTFVSVAGQLSSDVELYNREVAPLVKTTTNTVVREYLASCLCGAAQLKGLEAYDSRTSTAFDNLVTERIKWVDVLGHGDRRDPVVALESESYNKHLYPYREAEYVNLVRLQDELFERKYFKNETAKNANIIEGAVNSHWLLTRAERGDPKEILKMPTLGVSPWEAILRFEPAIVFDNGGQAAVMGTFGLTRTFFPSVDHGVNGATFDESFWSKTVQKAGLRAGVGAEIDNDQAKVLLGVGAQVWSVGVWGFYKPDDSEFLIGVSMSDLSKLKKIFGWFD